MDSGFGRRFESSGSRAKTFSRHFEIASMAFWSSLELVEAISESLTWNVAREEHGFAWNASESSIV
jgi:hypothetical protein